MRYPCCPVVRDARGRRGSGGEARIRDGSEGTIEKCHVQARHHQDAETRGQVRSLHQVHPLGRVPGRVLRSDHGRLLRHRVPVLRRLRQMRRDLPGQRVHRDGG